jgi:hypothetical protein
MIERGFDPVAAQCKSGGCGYGPWAWGKSNDIQENRNRHCPCKPSRNIAERSCSVYSESWSQRVKNGIPRLTYRSMGLTTATDRRKAGEAYGRK